MWYWHQIWSGVFVIGIAGNIAAGIIGFCFGILVAHLLYDLRAIHKTIREHTSKRRGKLPDCYTNSNRLSKSLLQLSHSHRARKVPEMSDTKIEVTAVTVDKEFGQIHGNELHDNGVKTHDLIIYTTRAMAAKAIMAEETGASVFALMDSRGEITEVWSE